MAERFRSDAGFSLLEVMASLFIISLIATSGATILMRVADSRETLERLNTTTRALHRVHALMREDLAQWVGRDFRPREDLDQPTRFVGGDRLEDGHLFSFVRDGWTNPGLEEDRASLFVVRYLIERGKLVRYVRLAPNGVIGTEEFSQTLLTGIKDYEIEFREGTSWVEQWQSKAGLPNGAPPAVKVSFELENGDQFAWQFLTPVKVAKQ